MGDHMTMHLFEDFSELIEKTSEKEPPCPPEELERAMRELAQDEDEAKSNDIWMSRYHDLPSYLLDVTRDGSDGYFAALTDAILAITKGDFGSIDYKGYKIIYTDTPHTKSISLEDGHKEYSYHICFRCEALMGEYYEEYHSEDERKAFMDPESDLFEKTIALLDKVIELLDNGTWIKEKKRLSISDFKDYSHVEFEFERIDWDTRNKKASDTFSYLLEDAAMRKTGLEYTENDFAVFADVIRRMTYFADYGKQNYLYALQGLIWFEWKPKTKKDRYIWHCMDEFGQGDLPDRLLDNCTLYYFIDDPKGWEALAYLLPIAALWEMCQEYDPDSVKEGMLKVFDLVPGDGYRERIEKLIEKDRAKAGKGDEDDQKNI